MKQLSVKRDFGLPVIAEVDPSSTVKLPDLEEALPGGGSHVVRLNFKTSRVGVY